jgi:hypothetical protein
LALEELGVFERGEMEAIDEIVHENQHTHDPSAP